MDGLSNSATVYLVDDDPVFTQLAATMLQRVVAKVLTYHSAEEFLSDWRLTDIDRFQFSSHMQIAAQALEIPDWPTPFSLHGCLLLDMIMPGMSGLELRQQIVDQNIYLPTVFVSGSATVGETVTAMKQGALTLLEKPPKQLIDWVESALEHDRLFRRAHAERMKLLTYLNTLSPRESLVLTGLMLGKTTGEIAGESRVKPVTVRRQRATVYEKLRVTSDTALRDLIERLRSRYQNPTLNPT